VVLAAGMGSRVGADGNKAYLRLAGGEHHADRGAGTGHSGHPLTLACAVGEPVQAGTIGERMIG